MNRLGVEARATARVWAASTIGVRGEAVVDVGGRVQPDTGVVVLVVVVLHQLVEEAAGGGA
ncbi:MAG: hypothetical protein ABI808_11250 [Pseudonocardiales bacterium]